ncbi:MAG: hypothetical protein Hyperionvirus3_41 [Hyperionvirus sp.]|uniref:Uncharacterized protein n=1 Tax=Hyperionvirus sp. TaxID=2487770 RepID=A0A3G5A6M9_9VIRU|nr:MAG: hypothetical protein Hyperionvirus3_41 [Hyperionvirus sp.]
MGYCTSYCFICSAQLYLDFCTLPRCLEAYEEEWGVKKSGTIVNLIESFTWLNNVIGIDVYGKIHQLVLSKEQCVLFEKVEGGEFWELGDFSNNSLRKAKKLEDENRGTARDCPTIGIAVHKKCYELLKKYYGYSLKLNDMKDLVGQRDQFHFFLKYVPKDPFDPYYEEEFDYIRFVNNNLLWLLEPPTEKNRNGKRILEKWREIIKHIKKKNPMHLYKKYKSKYLKLKKNLL